MSLARTKQKYPSEPESQQAAVVSFAGLPYSLDLKGAAVYTDFSVTDLRVAITSGELAVVSDKPYRILRTKLEEWVNAKNHFVQKKRKAKAA